MTVTGTDLEQRLVDLVNTVDDDEVITVGELVTASGASSDDVCAALTRLVTRGRLSWAVSR